MQKSSRFKLKKRNGRDCAPGRTIDGVLEGLGQELWPRGRVQGEPHGRLQHSPVLNTNIPSIWILFFKALSYSYEWAECGFDRKDWPVPIFFLKHNNRYPKNLQD